MTALKVLIVASELYPLVKSGRLADVAGPDPDLWLQSARCAGELVAGVEQLASGAGGRRSARTQVGGQSQTPAHRGGARTLHEGKGLRNGIIDWEDTFSLRWWQLLACVAAGTESGPFQVLGGKASTIADLLSGREFAAHGGC